MLRFSLLGSGSSGNAAIIVSRRSKILIDNGLSFRQLQARVEEVGESLEGLEAVFLTHEHGDHVAGVGTLARKLGVPVFITRDTYANLPQGVGQLPKIELFEAGDSVSVGDMQISSFSVSHDAADPVGYCISSEGAKLGFATDVGQCSHLVRLRLAGSHALVLESNYCPDMLRRGVYPAMVQQRIRSRMGHLSNHDMSSLLSALLHESLRLVVLVHISEKNNHPDLARTLAAQVIRDRPIHLHVASQVRPTQLFEVSCP